MRLEPGKSYVLKSSNHAVIRDQDGDLQNHFTQGRTCLILSIDNMVDHRSPDFQLDLGEAISRHLEAKEDS